MSSWTQPALYRVFTLCTNGRRDLRLSTRLASSAAAGVKGTPGSSVAVGATATGADVGVGVGLELFFWVARFAEGFTVFTGLGFQGR